MGIGAVLSQEIDGAERVIAFGSRTLSKSERKYCVTRKELLAVVARYVDVESDKAVVKLDRGDDVSTLEIEIELPTPSVEESRLNRLAS